jgi:hypothetical protein
MRAPSTTLSAPLPTPPLHARVWNALRCASAHIAAYLARRRDAYVAATLYQNLSKLSDAELERRGIARGDLHRHLSENSTDR